MAQETAGIQTPQPQTPQSNNGNFLQGLGGALSIASGPLGLAVGLVGSAMSFADAKKQRT